MSRIGYSRQNSNISGFMATHSEKRPEKGDAAHQGRIYDGKDELNESLEIFKWKSKHFSTSKKDLVNSTKERNSASGWLDKEKTSKAKASN